MVSKSQSLGLCALVCGVMVLCPALRACTTPVFQYARERWPADAYEVAWARQTIGETLERMRTECLARGREDVWRVFECRIVQPTLEGSPAVSYESLVKRFGYRSPLQSANVLITAKRMYRRMLRSVVAEYAGADRVEEEIADLRRILAKGGA